MCVCVCVFVCVCVCVVAFKAPVRVKRLVPKVLTDRTQRYSEASRGPPSLQGPTCSEKPDANTNRRHSHRSQTVVLQKTKLH